MFEGDEKVPDINLQQQVITYLVLKLKKIAGI